MDKKMSACERCMHLETDEPMFYLWCYKEKRYIRTYKEECKHYAPKGNQQKMEVRYW